jgi:hypothetical protein
VTFNEWIKIRGVDKTASTLSLPAATIYSWMRRGTIPRSAWPDIVLKFAELGINDLLTMEAASKKAEK